MAQLTICPACSANISASAVACPHCGHPLRMPRQTEGALMQTANLGCMMILWPLAILSGVVLLVLLVALVADR